MAVFDREATTYDADFTATRLGRWLRERLWQTLAEVCMPGQQVLELGCGTGEDAVWLARRGVSVVATDASAAMLALVDEKARQAGVADRIQLVQIDAAHLGVGGVYDAALADFGVLNCLADRRGFGQDVADRLRPGAHLVTVVMGPVCVWDVGWHLVHGEPRRAVRRWGGGASANVRGAQLDVWYPSPGRLRAELAPHFTLRRLLGLGTLLPPSYLSHLVDHWPRLFGVLAALDSRVPFGAWLADHYVAVFERR